MKILFTLGGGIGNIIQATPTIKLVAESHHVDLLLFCNSSSDLAEILNLSCVGEVFINKAPDTKYDIQLRGPFTPNKKYNVDKYYSYQINYAQHIPETEVYYDLALQMGIYPTPLLPNPEINVSTKKDNLNNAVVLYPGSKPNWAMKRWDKYDSLAERFEKVTIVGKEEDIKSHGDPTWIKKPWSWPENVRFRTGSLMEMASYISNCKMFIGNDGGLSHVAAATGVPTYIIFGPSSIVKNKPISPNAHAIGLSLPCKPCQFKKIDGKTVFDGNRSGCPYDMKCMKELTVDEVIRQINALQ